MPSKSTAQNTSNMVRTRFFIIVVTALVAMGASLGTSESGGPLISLNAPGPEMKTFMVAKNAEVRLSNDSKMTLRDFTVIQVASGRRILSIRELEPHASLNLAFEYAGTYIACYSGGIKTNLSQSTCLQIDVVGLRPA